MRCRSYPQRTGVPGAYGGPTSALLDTAFLGVLRAARVADMFIAYLVVAVLLALLLLASGSLLLAKEKGVTTTMTELGVPLSWFPLLATAKFAGALGLLAGIVHRPLGIAASIGIVLYFTGAVITHLRAKDIKGILIPTVLAVVSTTPLLLGIASM